MKVLVIASFAPSLVNFRGALLGAMVAARHNVIACAPDDDPDTEAALSAIGVGYRRIPMQRAGMNPLADLRTATALVRLMIEERPDLVLAYTQKPIIYGGLATRLAGRRARFAAMMTGLGYIGIADGARLRRAVRRLVAAAFRFAVGRAHPIIVFNRDDAGDLRRHGMVSPGQAIIQVPGSGVDIERFAPSPLPPGPPVFLMIARLLRDKGVAQYAAAARIVRDAHPHARFVLVGPFDPNPSGISRADLAAWVAHGAIEYHGATADVRPHLAAASVFVLPSFREGLPRAVLEAMATGRPIVTTDAPGCRETVIPGDNGFLVPVGSVAPLAEAMTAFINDPTLAQRMGGRSRELATERFSVDRVNARLLDLLDLDRIDVRPIAARQGVSAGAAASVLDQ